MEASPAVVTRQELETRVWGEELPDSDSLRVHIHGLRAVVDKPFPILLIQTRHGIGYRIAEPDANTCARTGAPAPFPAAAAQPPHPVVRPLALQNVVSGKMWPCLVTFGR